MQAPTPTPASPLKNETLLYETFSVCGVCALLEKRGLLWKDAWVIKRDEKIYIRSRCRDHGSQETLYCSSASFFEKVMSLSLERVSQKVPDIEDLRQKMDYTKKSKNSPLIMELNIYRGNEFMTDDKIRDEITRFKTFYPPNKKFVVKVSGKISTDIKALNAKAAFVASLLPRHPVVCEMSFERLHLVGRLPDSVLYKPNVYPAVKYLVRRGDEAQCIADLELLFNSLREYTDISIMVTLIVDRPFADLSLILTFLRSKVGLVRFLCISMERSPRELVHAMERKITNNQKDSSGVTLDALKRIAEDLKRQGGVAKDDGSSPSTSSSYWDTTDPVELLKLIQAATAGDISVDDFVPASVGMLLEPFLENMGYGSFVIRPSAFCGFGTILVNSAPRFASVPLTRLYDLPKFFREVSPILAAGGGIGWSTAGKVKKALQSSAIEKDLPDVFAYLTDASYAETTAQFIRNLQFVIVHNNMDLAAVDMIRRCNCMMATTTTLTPTGTAAACTGCI